MVTTPLLSISTFLIRLNFPLHPPPQIKPMQKQKKLTKRPIHIENNPPQLRRPLGSRLTQRCKATWQPRTR